MQSKHSTLACLQAMYPGAVLVDTEQVARIMGVSPKTIRNLRDKFPVPSLKIGDCRRFRLVDVAAVVDAGLGFELEMPKFEVPAPRRSRGRPRKVTEGAA